MQPVLVERHPFNRVPRLSALSVFHQIRVYPPSTRKSAPVMYLAESLSMKITGPMMSSGAPTLPAGINEIHLSRNSAFSSKILRVLEHDLATDSLGRQETLASLSHLQGSQNIPRTYAIHIDVMSGPLHSK